MKSCCRCGIEVMSGLIVCGDCGEEIREAKTARKKRILRRKMTVRRPVKDIPRQTKRGKYNKVAIRSYKSLET